jgi:hypothetical protein
MEDANRIDVGMARKQVEGILGAPRDESTAPLATRPETDAEVGWWVDPPELCVLLVGWPPSGSDSACWCTDEFVLVVIFDREEKVCMTSIIHTLRRPQTALDNLLWRLKRPFRHWFANG